MHCTRLEVTEARPRPSLRLQRHALAAPAARQVLVEMAATSVNPIDAKRAQGYGQRVLRLKGAGRFPLTLGNDLVGKVSAVGAAVQGFKPGDRVFGLKATGASGTHASHVLAEASHLRQAPAAIPAAELAVLPYTFTTMLLALRGAGLSPGSARGRSVLVLGASGGLGQLALQLLAGWGAETTAVCSTPSIALCRGLGAAHTVDRLATPLHALPAGFDAVLNFAAWDDDGWLASRLRPGALGHATTVHPLLGNIDRLGWLRGGLQTLADKRRVAAVARQAAPGARYAWTLFQPDGAALDLLAAGLAQGRFTLALGCVVALADAAQAFDHVLEGRAGRAALLCRDPAAEAP